MAWNIVLVLAILLNFDKSFSCFNGATNFQNVENKQDLLPVLLAGSIRFERVLPERIPNGFLSEPSKLRCSFEEECSWRNEIGREGAEEVDELDFGIAAGSPDPNLAKLVFGINKTRHEPGAGPWAVAGTFEKKDTEVAALLVSDPVQCQADEGSLFFEYWTSPNTEVSACTRDVDGGKNFIFCSPGVSKGDPGPAVVIIPASQTPFEIVLMAKKFDFELPLFEGKQVQGGIVGIDNINYYAEFCNGEDPIEPEPGFPEIEETITWPVPSLPDAETATLEPEPFLPEIEETAPLSVTDEPPIEPIEGLDPDLEACQMLKCTIDDGACLEQLGERGEGWWAQEGPLGNKHTGIREEHKGSYAVIRGEKGSKDVPSFSTAPFELLQPQELRFCYYMASATAVLTLAAPGSGSSLETEPWTSPKITPTTTSDFHDWKCPTVVLEPGSYFLGLEFSVKGMRNRFNYLALDEIELLDGDTGLSLC